ncbi:hypothetical protein KIL84_015874, partial [Mauremys mutica]
MKASEEEGELSTELKKIQRQWTRVYANDTTCIHLVMSETPLCCESNLGMTSPKEAHVTYQKMAFDNQLGIMKVYECTREVHQDLERKLPGDDIVVNIHPKVPKPFKTWNVWNPLTNNGVECSNCDHQEVKTKTGSKLKKQGRGVKETEP